MQIWVATLLPTLRVYIRFCLIVSSTLFAASTLAEPNKSVDKLATYNALANSFASHVKDTRYDEIQRALEALSRTNTHMAVVFDEDLTPLAYVGASDFMESIHVGEALSDTMSLWAAELNGAEQRQFHANENIFNAFAMPISLNDQKFANLLIVEKSIAPIEAREPVFSRSAVIVILTLFALLFTLATVLAKWVHRSRNLDRQIQSFHDQGFWRSVGSRNEASTPFSRWIEQSALNFRALQAIKDLQKSALNKSSAPELNETVIQVTANLFECDVGLIVDGHQCLFPESSTQMNNNTKQLIENLINTVDAQEPGNPLLINEHGEAFSIYASKQIASGLNYRLLLVSTKAITNETITVLEPFIENVSFIYQQVNGNQLLTNKLNDSEKKLLEERALRIELMALSEKVKHQTSTAFAFIGSGGLVEESASDSFCSLLASKQVYGRRISEILFSRCNLAHENIRQAEAAIDLILGGAELMFDLNKNKLPANFTQFNEDGSRDVINLHWAPIAVNGVVEQIYVELSNVSREAALEYQVKALRQEIELIGQVLNAPSDAFGQFILHCTEIFDRITSSLKGVTTTLSELQTYEIHQLIHSLKHESRNLNLTQISDLLYQLELLVDSGVQSPSECASSIEILSMIQTIKQTLQRYQHVDENVLKRSESADQKGLSIKQVQKLRARINDLKGAISTPLKSEFEQISALLTKASYTTLSHLINHMTSHCEEMAIQLGKAPPVIHLTSEELWLSDSAVAHVKEKLSLLVNHIISHSIESIPDRAKANKPPSGQIYIAFRPLDDFIEITCSNDGRGISQERLARYFKVDNGATSVAADDLLQSTQNLESNKVGVQSTTLPFELRFHAAEDGNYRAYDGVLKISAQSCWFDEPTQPRTAEQAG